VVFNPTIFNISFHYKNLDCYISFSIVISTFNGSFVLFNPCVYTDVKPSNLYVAVISIKRMVNSLLFLLAIWTWVKFSHTKRIMHAYKLNNYLFPFLCKRKTKVKNINFEVGSYASQKHQYCLTIVRSHESRTH